MPYKFKSDLPEKVKNALPEHAQEIYMEVYNSACDQYDEPEEGHRDSSREEIARRLAWAAVKNKYEKDESTGKWKEK